MISKNVSSKSWVSWWNYVSYRVQTFCTVGHFLDNSLSLIWASCKLGFICLWAMRTKIKLAWQLLVWHPPPPPHHLPHRNPLGMLRGETCGWTDMWADTTLHYTFIYALYENNIYKSKRCENKWRAFLPPRLYNTQRVLFAVKCQIYIWKILGSNAESAHISPLVGTGDTGKGHSPILQDSSFM
jgi:hypothetical protein